MEQFFTTFPGIIVTIGGILAVASVGGLYVAGLIKGKKDEADDRLINILQETVNALEEKVNKQKEDHDTEVGKLNEKIDKLTTKVSELEKENETLIEVLQGRDKSTLEFQKQMLDAMRVGMETNGLAKDTATKLQHLIDLMGQHIVAVEANQKAGK